MARERQPPSADLLSPDHVLDVILDRADRADFPITLRVPGAEDFPLRDRTVGDAAQLELLVGIVRDKVATLSARGARERRTRLTIAEALSHALMSPRWLGRAKT